MSTSLRMLLVAAGMLVIVPYLFAQPTLEWSNIYGTDSVELVFEVETTSDGAFLLVAQSFAEDPGYFWVGKVARDGELLWDVVQTYEFPPAFEDPEAQVIGVFEVDDGYRLLFHRWNNGEGMDDIAMYPISMDGEYGELEVVFENSWDGSPYFPVFLETDDGYAMAGGPTEWPYPGPDLPVYLLELDSDLNVTSEESYTFGAETWVSVDAGVYLSGTGYAFAGSRETVNGDDARDLQLMMIDDNGTLAWSETFGDPSHRENPSSLLATSDGGFLVTGEQELEGAESANFHVLKTDGSGTVEWETSFSGDMSWSIFSDAIEDYAGEYILTGITTPDEGDLLNADIVLTKLDADGNERWTVTFGEADQLDIASAVVPHFDDSVYLIGAQGTMENVDGWVAKTTNDVLFVETDNRDMLPETSILLGAYPNPFNDQATIRVQTSEAGLLDVRVFDLLGREVLTAGREVLPAGVHRFSLRGEGIGSGVYFVRAIGPNGVSQVRKVTLLR
ncbi:T9SS type A sorting domain-containing protein [bacterium]|nr:T9SS type A sorting domain-containing protein [bacterium]